MQFIDKNTIMLDGMVTHSKMFDKTGPLSAQELFNTNLTLIKLDQTQTFGKVFLKFKKKNDYLKSRCFEDVGQKQFARLSFSSLLL